MSQPLRLVILWSFLVIFLPTTWIYLMKLRFWCSFWGASCASILIILKATSWKTFFGFNFFFQFWKKKFWKHITHKWPFLDHFGSFFANYMSIFHKTEVQTVILRCLGCLNLNWIKSYNMILITIKRMFAWKCIISRVVCRSVFWHLRRKPALVF